MKIKTIFTLGVCALLSLSGCNLQAQKTGGGTKGGGGNQPTSTMGPNDCDSSDRAYGTDPFNYATVDNLTPTFQWTWPQDDECYPDHFFVHIKTGPYFADDVGGPADYILYHMAFQWTTPTALEPGREYAWGIEAVGDAIPIPYTGDLYFFTGPTCASDSLVAPGLLDPLNNWIVHDLGSLELKWWYPGACLPDGYGVDLSTSLVFDGSPLSFITSTPSMRGVPAHALADCTRYYWRVQAIKDNQPGPYSQVYTFRVAISGGCPAETKGLIQGTVWEDQCAGPGPGTPVANPLPLGCVLTGNNILFPNQSYDPGEPGIPGLIVTLGQGACPSSGYREVESGPDGTFNFYTIPAGTYCAGLTSNDPINDPILNPGTWTYPANAVNQILANQTVVVGQGEDVKNANFGWWYAYGAGWGSTDAAVFGTVWHDLCAYNPGDPVPNPLPAGCVVDVWGNVHADATRQTDEPGIPGVVVDLGPGDCPSAGLATAVTDGNGYYHFSDLPAGKYCLRIDPVHNPTNAAVLLPGSWTVIPSGHEGMTFRPITLVADHTLSGMDFGWDYDHLPVQSTPALPVQPSFSLTANANCREGPDTRYAVVTSYPAGKTFPIEGKSGDGNWYFVKLTGSARCWFNKSMGTTGGDLSGLHTFYGPPLPTNTAPLVCAVFKDKASCTANPACTWVFTTAGPGVCKSK